METAFSITLGVLLAFQSFLSLLLICPWVVSKPIVQLFRLTRGSPAASAATYTVGAALGAICASSIYEIFFQQSSADARDTHGSLLAKIDRHRAWLSAILSAVNLILLFVDRAFALEKFELDKARINLATMLKQVKGLQTEYNRVTTGPSEADSGTGEAGALKNKLQQLEDQNKHLKDAADEAQATAASAEARVSAMVAQVKGMDKEYDRLLAENAQLQRLLAQYDPSYARQSKKNS